MERGTYSEAIKAGFTPDQAAFFARMCIDTKSEALAYMVKEREKEKKGSPTSRVLVCLGFFLTSFIITSIIVQLLIN